MLKNRTATTEEKTTAAARFAILFCLWIWMFWPELNAMLSAALRSSEMAHALIAPLAIVLLIYHRRTHLADGVTKGSVWGLAFIILGLLIYAGAMWPFSYGYARDIMPVPVLAGVILVSCGPRPLKLSLPMLLIVLLAIPIGSRLYATLVIRPETYTIAATAEILNLLPSVEISARGTDLFYVTDKISGVIALGESNRGARLLMAYAAIGVFVIFSRIRSPGRIVSLAILGPPIILFCNFLRFLCWGLTAICTKTDPTSMLMRNSAAICSLLVAYALFAFASAFSLNLFVEVDAEDTELKEPDDE